MSKQTNVSSFKMSVSSFQGSFNIYIESSLLYKQNVILPVEVIKEDLRQIKVNEIKN